MNSLVPFLWAAGVIQLLDVAVNLALPRKIQCRENLARVSPLVRQVFIVHWFYILFVLVVFGTACLLLAPDLAAGSPLARFVCGSMALFWLLRVPIQVLYFDPEIRRRHRAADLSFTISSAFMGLVYAGAALGLGT